MLTSDELRVLIDRSLAMPLERLELSEAMFTALKHLRRTTVRGLTALRECDLYDALDLDTALGEAAKSASIADARFILNEMVLALNPEGRFESFATLMRWTIAAAREHELRVEEDRSDPQWPTLTIHLMKPKGSVRIRERNNLNNGRLEQMLPFREIYDPDFTTRKATDKGMVLVRQVMRRAEALAADEE